MRNLFVVASFLAVSAVAVHALAPERAEGAPVFKVALASVDGGSTQTVQIAAKACYCAQAKFSETCVKFDRFDGGNFQADCTKDFVIPQPVGVATLRQYPYFCFDSANRTSITARNLDGGTSDVNLYTLEANPANPGGCTTLGWGP